MKTLFTINTPAEQTWSGVTTCLYILVDDIMRVIVHCKDGGVLVQHVENTLDKKRIEKLMDAHGVTYA